MAFYNVAAMAVMVASAAASTYATYTTADNNRRMSNYNAEQGRLNALDATERGAIEAAEHRQKVRQIISRQNAMYGASGIDASTGTPLEIQAETAGTGELDALRIINNAQRTSGGLQAQADIDVFKGKSGMQEAYWKIAGDTLGSASSMVGPASRIIDKVKSK